MIMIAKSCNETRFRLFWDALYSLKIHEPAKHEERLEV